MFFVCRSMIRLYRKGIPGSVEQPRTSRMWLMTAMLRAEARTKAFRTHVVYCAFGEAWRKETTFMHWLLPRLDELACQCRPVNRICAFSAKPHIVLEGSHQGRRRTLAAQAYPRKLCQKFAKLVRAHFLDRYVNQLDKSMHVRHAAMKPLVPLTTQEMPSKILHI